ncbi:MAG: phosphatidate cytidylyltransferase [Prevotellaceae bacterium]|nr:phosphatidate cytidylyltransferase [Prevotellaceae bacterium]
MKNLVIRTLSGIVYIGIILGAIFIHPCGFIAVFAILSALTVHEFHRLTRSHEDTKVLIYTGAAASLLLFVGLSAELFLPSNIGLIIYGMLVFALFIAEIFCRNQNPIRNISQFLLGQVYIAVPFALMSFIYFENKLLLLALFVIIWANDTFAYLCGSFFGKHRMCPSISPKKSWEGFAGGMAGALLAGFVFNFATSFQVNSGTSPLCLWQWLVFAAIAVIFGTLGDLYESKIKRAVGVKDSGKIMPGHGGLLDRFDSLLFAAVPEAAFLILLLM